MSSPVAKLIANKLTASKARAADALEWLRHLVTPKNTAFAEKHMEAIMAALTGGTAAQIATWVDALHDATEGSAPAAHAKGHVEAAHAKAAVGHAKAAVGHKEGTAVGHVKEGPAIAHVKRKRDDDESTAVQARRADDKDLAVADNKAHCASYKQLADAIFRDRAVNYVKHHGDEVTIVTYGPGRGHRGIGVLSNHSTDAVAGEVLATFSQRTNKGEKPSLHVRYAEASLFPRQSQLWTLLREHFTLHMAPLDEDVAWLDGEKPEVVTLSFTCDGEAMTRDEYVPLGKTAAAFLAENDGAEYTCEDSEDSECECECDYSEDSEDTECECGECPVRGKTSKKANASGATAKHSMAAKGKAKGKALAKPMTAAMQIAALTAQLEALQPAGGAGAASE